MHLNVYIAKSGIASRRKAAVLIKEGKVVVNGSVVTEPWREVGDRDHVRVGEKKIKVVGHLYVVFNKPKGVTATVEDKFAEKKVTDFLAPSMKKVYPVGRLDKSSRGLIILTNDGDLCYRITHPKFEVEKEYAVIVKGHVELKTMEKLKSGIWDGIEMLKVKSVRVSKELSDKTALKIVVSEGRKRHLRRLLRAAGHPVVDLRRIRIGSMLLGDLKEGSYRVIDKKTAYALTSADT